MTGDNYHQNNNNNFIVTRKQYPLVSNKELKNISEQLFDELPNILHSLNLNFQVKKYSKSTKDECLFPLFTIPKEFFESFPILQLIYKLYDNYNIYSNHAEDMTVEENIEENAFINSLLDTKIMANTMNFLATKGYFRKNLDTYKQIIKKIWFGLYSRSNHTSLGSSGFEHVFLVEQRKDRRIIGLHNWIFFAIEESNEKVNYLGYINNKRIDNKAVVAELYFNYLNKTKSSSMFIGTLPEFDIALYTICFFTRPNKNCNIQLKNEKITIQSWVQHSHNEKFIASSFPKV
ncbi:PREDICTED: poly(U)-specific endoribonuclease homolog [Ceratosolen solmsi marchali]|uniref:Poly(U)-specific endoribonuclease homolog n=1 Tax=Ceratosolen solmsi marchali TaxID=326594 RepID=A0AAJ7DYM3_9HYME|nr:PREDICTED: poly(U)-specific endoribonuclease homolog [Ceratosolen solmsi marchali]